MTCTNIHRSYRKCLSKGPKHYIFCKEPPRRSTRQGGIAENQTLFKIDRVIRIRICVVFVSVVFYVVFIVCHCMSLYVAFPSDVEVVHVW